MSRPSSGRGSRCARGANSVYSGIWVNTASRTFIDPPSYLAVLPSRPLDAITSVEIQRKLQLGIADTPLPELINNDIGE